MDSLKTNISLVKNVSNYTIKENALSEFDSILDNLKVNKNAFILFFIDDYFINNSLNLNVKRNHFIQFINTKKEPSTDSIDLLMNQLKNKNIKPNIIVGIGGGIVMDTAKAISNLYTNMFSSLLNNAVFSIFNLFIYFERIFSIAFFLHSLNSDSFKS